MFGFVRHVSAVLVAIALVAAQIMPAWAGCHSQRHAVAATMTTDVVKTDAAGHHGMAHTPDIKADVSLVDHVRNHRKTTSASAIAAALVASVEHSCWRLQQR